MSKSNFIKFMRKDRKKDNTINNYISSINGVSRHYSATTGTNTNIFKLESKDLELLRQIRALYNRGGRYSKMGDTGNGAYRASINMYFRCIAGDNNETPDGFYNEEDLDETENEESEEIIENEDQNNFTYESDLQTALEKQAEELFPGYKIFGDNEGPQYNINGKKIDLLLEHKTENKLLVVELKAGTADFKVFGQISMYIGPLKQKYPDKEISGVIIAGEIDESLKFACLTSDRIALKEYQMKITLGEV